MLCAQPNVKCTGSLLWKW